MAYSKKAWVDDDGSLTVGTLFSAANMNNIEAGISGLIEILEKAGMGVVVHGATKATARPASFDVVVWIGTVEPEHGAENDLWINPEDFGINSTTFVPAAAVYKAAGQSLVASTLSGLVFDTKRYDNAGIWSSGKADRLTAPKAGVYLLDVNYYFPTGLTASLIEWVVRKNEVNWAGGRYSTDVEEGVHFTVVVKMEAGDFLQILAYNPAASAKTTSAGLSPVPQEASLTYLGTGTASLLPVDWGLVTELPAGAGVGDTCELKIRENESSPWKVWDCVKVEASGERPWAKKGGPPLVAELETGVTGATNTAYAALSCEVKTPAKGDYLVTINGQIATSAAGIGGLLSYSVGATAASDADSVNYSPGWAGQQGRTKKKSAIAASTAIKLAYRVTSGNGNFNNVSVAIDPVRLG